MKLSFVVPVFNESENVEECYRRICRAAEPLDAGFELIFVDDGSSDRSYDVLRRLRSRDPRVKVIGLSRNFGQQIALTAGLDAAEGEAVITLDADLQHPPELLPELVRSWQNGAEIVHTVRISSGDEPLFKKLLSRGFYKCFARISGISLQKNAADFRLLDRRVVEALRRFKEGHRFIRGLISWAGFSSACVTYQAQPRHGGKSRYSFSRMLQLGADGLLAFSAAPLHAAVWLGLLFCFLGFIYAGYILYVKIATQSAVPGWASIAFVVSVLGGIQLMVLGVMGLYIGRIYDEVKRRPLYLLRAPEPPDP